MNGPITKNFGYYANIQDRDCLVFIPAIWIKASQRLPTEKDGKTFLCYFKTLNISPQSFICTKIAIRDLDWMSKKNSDEFSHFTHWLPIDALKKIYHEAKR